MNKRPWIDIHVPQGAHSVYVEWHPSSKDRKIESPPPGCGSGNSTRIYLEEGEAITVKLD